MLTKAKKDELLAIVSKIDIDHTRILKELTSVGQGYPEQFLNLFNGSTGEFSHHLGRFTKEYNSNQVLPMWAIVLNPIAKKIIKEARIKPIDMFSNSLANTGYNKQFREKNRDAYAALGAALPNTQSFSTLMNSCLTKEEDRRVFQDSFSKRTINDLELIARKVFSKIIISSEQLPLTKIGDWGTYTSCMKSDSYGKGVVPSYACIAHITDPNTFVAWVGTSTSMSARSLLRIVNIINADGTINPEPYVYVDRAYATPGKESDYNSLIEGLVNFIKDTNMFRGLIFMENHRGLAIASALPKAVVKHSDSIIGYSSFKGLQTNPYCDTVGYSHVISRTDNRIERGLTLIGDYSKQGRAKPMFDIVEFSFKKRLTPIKSIDGQVYTPHVKDFNSSDSAAKLTFKEFLERAIAQKA